MPPYNSNGDLSGFLSKQPKTTGGTAGNGLENSYRAPSASGLGGTDTSGLENAYKNSPSGNLPPPPETYTPPPGFAENPGSAATSSNFSPGFSAPTAAELAPAAEAGEATGLLGGLGEIATGIGGVIFSPEVIVPLLIGGAWYYLSNKQPSKPPPINQPIPSPQYQYGSADGWYSVIIKAGYDPINNEPAYLSAYDLEYYRVPGPIQGITKQTFIVPGQQPPIDKSYAFFITGTNSLGQEVLGGGPQEIDPNASTLQKTGWTAPDPVLQGYGSGTFCYIVAILEETTGKPIYNPDPQYIPPNQIPTPVPAPTQFVPNQVPGNTPTNQNNPQNFPPPSLIPSENSPPAPYINVPPGPFTITPPGGLPSNWNPPPDSSIKFPNPNQPGIGWSIGGQPSGGTSTGTGTGTGTKSGTITFPGVSPTSPVVINFPGYQPITIPGPNNELGTGFTPNPLNPSELKPNPLPGTLIPPSTTPTKSPAKTPASSTDNSNPTDILEDPRFQAVLTGVLTIGQIIQGISKNTTPAAQQAATTAGTCQTTQPGGCLNNLVNGAANNVNNNTNNLLKALGLGNLGANLAEIVAYLKPILDIVTTTKAGLEKFYEWSKPGRILDMLNFLLVLHNAFMLSSAVKQTILQMVQDWMQVEAPFFKVFGVDIPKTDGSEGSLDLNKLLDNTIEGFFEFFIGETKVKQYEELFKTVIRAYQAATNLLMNIQMAFFGMTMALEILATNSSSVHNALKRYGVVGHNAYPWQNPNPQLTNKWIGTVEAATGKINGLIAGAVAIDAIAQGILQSRQAVDQLGKQKDELAKEVKTAYAVATAPETVPEYKKALADAQKSQADSKGKTPTAQDIANVLDGVFK